MLPVVRISMGHKLFVCGAALGLAVLTTTVAADIIRVPADSPTIQIAIQKAQPFDTIIVAPGTYYEAINFQGKVITIQSEDPNSAATVGATIIDGSGLGVAVTFQGNEGGIHTTLNGLTVTGGTLGIAGYGTGATIQNCIVRNNSGTGIVSVHGRIARCTVRANSNGGLSNCNGIISDCLVTNNPNWFGFSQCNGRIERCRVTNNSVGLDSCSASVRQSIIAGNREAGLRQCSGNLVDNCVIAGNLGSGFADCGVRVLNCTVTGNRLYGFLRHSGTIKQCIIWDNAPAALTGSTTPLLSGTVNRFL